MLRVALDLHHEGEIVASENPRDAPASRLGKRDPARAESDGPVARRCLPMCRGSRFIETLALMRMYPRMRRTQGNFSASFSPGGLTTVLFARSSTRPSRLHRPGHADRLRCGRAGRKLRLRRYGHQPRLRADEEPA